MSSTSPSSLLSIPADCRLAVILAGASFIRADRLTLRCFLLLCKDFCKLVLANWAQIVEHYTMKEVLPDETQYTFCGRLHRDNDLPAVICTNKTRKWYQHNKLHRDNDLPAIIWADGSQEWYYHGKLHRDNDLPAVIWTNGTQWWYHNKLHRDNDLPAIIATRVQYWYKHGKVHRDNDLPAIICTNGSQEWHQYGKFIRKQ